MTDQNNATVVSGVSYNAANQILSIAGTLSETRTYNANLQLMELVSGSYHYKYNYSATQNNGRITSLNDVISGETITYQYDSLNRLINASGTGDPQGNWTQAFTFDGFGNLSQKTSSNAPALSVAIDATTNRLASNGAGYDANGNLTAYGTGVFAASYSYDVENRLNLASVSGASYGYGYDSLNERVFSGTISGSTYANELIYFYGPTGKKLGVWSYSSSAIQNVSVNQWFAGRLLKGEDRLQSVGKYFPYGEDRNSPNPPNPANDQEKFATYTRDSATGLDYAVNRYYDSVLARFMTTDPYQPSAHPGHPQSWNRYAYVDGDPIGGLDPTGLFVSPAWPKEGPGNDNDEEGGWEPGGLGEEDGTNAFDSHPYLSPPPDPHGGNGRRRPFVPGWGLAVHALLNPECAAALGASSQAAEDKLNSATVSYANLGSFIVKETSSGMLQLVSGSPYAQSTNSSITINSNLNMMAPNETLASIAGSKATTYWPAAQALANQVGAPSLSAEQFGAMITLHELDHMLGAPRETQATSQAYNKNIWDHCLKGLK